MSEAAIFVVTMCALVSLLSFIAYQKTDGRAVKLALGLILISALISPAREVISAIPEINPEYEYGEPSGEMREKAIEDAFCEGVAEAVANKFMIDAKLISVSAVGFDAKKMRCDVLRVRLYGVAALADGAGIERFLTECGADRGEVMIQL